MFKNRLGERRKNMLKAKYGPWALVTGASSGIGKALASLLAESGFNIILTARSAGKLDGLAQSLLAAHDIQAVCFPADLSKDQDVVRLLRFCVSYDVGLVVNSAGFGTAGEMTNSSSEIEMEMLNLNVVALFKITDHFVRKFKTRGKGGIVLLSSAASFQGMPYLAHYSATKAYVQSLGEGLYHELKSYGVDILCGAPGPVATNFAERAKMKMDMAMSAESVATSILKSLGSRNTVVPGAVMSALMKCLKLLPRSYQVRLMRAINRRMVL